MRARTPREGADGTGRADHRRSVLVCALIGVAVTLSRELAGH